MLIFRLSGVFILLQYSPSIYAGGSCQENIYLEVGKQGLVSCNFENFDIIGWINGDGNVRDTSPFIYIEGSKIYGRGYRSGDYDMHPNGSVIINEVKLENEFNYTVLLVPPGGGNEYFKVPVKVYVPPDPWHPVVNGLTNQQQVVIHGIRSGSITCSMAGVRPKVDLEWVASPDEITLDGTPTVTNNSDGTYDVSLNSNFRVLDGAMGNVIFMCRATGHEADSFTSETDVYLLNQVNGLYNQKHIILDVNREGELSCTSKGVSESVSLELSIVSPVSSNVIPPTTSSKRNNNDGTFSIERSSNFRVLSRSMERVALECRVFDRITNTSLDVTTVELFLPEYQESDCTSRWSPDVNTVILVILLFMNDEIPPETSSSKRNNNDGTFSIKRSSHFRVLGRSMGRVTLECRVCDRTTNTSLDVTTVELFLPEYQESDCTSQWSPGLNTVILLLMNGIKKGSLKVPVYDRYAQRQRALEKP